ncbi:hypothetical protein YSY43_00510 [Paenibacillus sp. YSY-4.3]
MKRKILFWTLISLSVIMLTACGGKALKSGGTEVTSTANSDTRAKFDAAYDLKNQDFYERFIHYMEMDKASLIDTLQQDFQEAPVEGADDAGAAWLKLEKAGLVFHLTEEEGVPISHVDIAEISPIHFGEVKAGMSFTEIMQRAGETMIMAVPSDEEEEKEFNLIYPVKGASVIFSSEQVFEKSAKMMVSSWGYYDEEPTLFSATEIRSYYGAFKLPENWVGHISLENSVETQLISFLGQKGAYPLVQIEYSHPSDGLSRPDDVQVVFENEDVLITAKLWSNEPANKKEAEQYRVMRSEVDKMLDTFKWESQETDVENAPSKACQAVDITKVGEVDAIFEAWLEQNVENYSEAGIDDAYSELGQCYTDKLNDFIAENNSSKNLAAELRTSISDVNTYWFELHYYADGGGTMWSHLSVRQGSTIDATIYGYLRQQSSEKGQASQNEKFNKLLQQLSEYRDYYRQNSVQALNEEDQALVDEAKEQLVESYDRLITIMDNITPNHAAVDLLEDLSRYNTDE